MSSVALAYSSPSLDPRRARALRKKHIVAPLKSRPWSDVRVAGVPMQAVSGHPAHIKRPQLAALGAAALLIHAVVAWYFTRHFDHRTIEPAKTELNIDLVRPPKPPEPPKVEPPRPIPPKPQLQHAQVLPQIQQSDPLPSTSGTASDVPVAVAPVATDATPAPIETVTAPIGRAGYLNNPPPDYPAQAVKQGWQGNVLLHVHVLATGKVDIVDVKESSGRKVLDDEAMRTVKKWLFAPSKRGDTPIDGWATVPIEFLLDQ